ncbi:nucleotidyltransferase family protein [Polycladidibacter stylochi]|uniref:nucleotidyltransferase family protein n=1 Tax=Polycladidibacter stylochi TaxID=1807766 RepID=UPI000832CC31|nr:nucleotidyltransferase family protein [Pseudovibrio stylochi]
MSQQEFCFQQEKHPLLVLDTHHASEQDYQVLLRLSVLQCKQLMIRLNACRSLNLNDYYISGKTVCWYLWAALVSSRSLSLTKILPEPVFVCYYRPLERNQLRAQNYNKLMQCLGGRSKLINVSQLNRNALLQYVELSQPISATTEALTRHPVQTYAFGIRLCANRRIEIFAPFGLKSVLQMQFTPNPLVVDPATYRKEKLQYLTAFRDD